MNHLSAGCGVQVYKKKLKHVLSEHHNEIVGLKMHTVEKSSLIQNQYTEAELWLQGMAHSLQKDLREREYHNNNKLKTLQLVSLSSASCKARCCLFSL